ncbi:hypothetical protein EPR50_G00201060 [Perca flavescens]|uniref:MAM domain-containing protein n=1 Tax=Perca flavescens TaxID=8167 RepID=A0A484C491_PERFV|nr:hypothetical protein EPR50_G00201060 [Perca flavescens]
MRGREGKGGGEGRRREEKIRWTKTAGGASDSPLPSGTLKISNISRHQGGRYYCKAENGLGAPAIRSIRVDVYYLDDPVITVHQSVGESKEQFYFERTVFLRCVANSNPPVHYSWRRGREALTQGSDAGVEIYEPFFTQMSQSRWWEQEIPMEGSIQKGELLTYNLTELVKPESGRHLVRHHHLQRVLVLCPSTAPVNPHLREFQCGFEDEALCLFSQDKTDDFEWTRHSAATRDTKYTPNTGPSTDRTGSKQGFYMYIETSRPRLEGDKARLLSPTFNTNSKTSSSSSVTYCFSFYYHMYGKHIGSLHVLLRQKGQTVTETSVWTLVGNQGDRWRQAKVNIHPAAAFQIVMEGVRGAGIEGDIAIDDVTIEEGECKDPPPNNLRSLAPPSSPHIWQLSVTLSLALIGRQR